MDYQNKTKQELIDELLQLHEKYNSVVELFEKDAKERKQTEQALRSSELKFRALFEQSGGYCMILDPNTEDGIPIIVDANIAACKEHGYTREEFIGRSVADLDNEEGKRLVKKHTALIMTGKPFYVENIHVRKDGTFFHVYVNAKRIDIEGEPPLIFTTEYDISEQKKTEQELIKAKEKAEESTLYAIERNKELNGLYSLDLLIEKYEDVEDIYVEFVNEVVPQSLQFPDKVVVILDINNQIYGNIENSKLQKGNESLSADIFIFKNKVGKLIVAYTEDLPFLKIFEQNLINAYAERISKISERIITRNELIVAKERAEESDRLKTEFINNMSHEIRTPMNGILGFSKLLDKPNKSEQKTKHYVSIIQNSGNQLMRIIDDILEISKLGTKQVKISEKEICLNDLLLELFSIFDIKAKENQTPLYLKKGLPDNKSLIFTDETKLNKILSNLLENALKFTNEGFIEFGYKLVEINRGRSLEIYVKDTGIGINTNKHETVFERFSQEEKELSKNVGGLGLGLSIAKENTELLGGQIKLESEKGKGAAFFVTIPYKPVNVDTQGRNSNADNAKDKLDKYTILIVEDEEVNYLFFETLIEDESELNCKTIHAKNGKEAVEICKENSEIDIILMDLKMPIMNGFEATKQIKEFRPNLPIVAQTAYTTNEDKEKAILAGCDGFISKPISEDAFYEILNKYLILR